jgi:hypothetical protein
VSHPVLMPTTISREVGANGAREYNWVWPPHCSVRMTLYLQLPRPATAMQKGCPSPCKLLSASMQYCMSVDTSGRRRVRGIAAVQVFASFLAVAANIRKFQKFYSEAITTPQGRIGIPVKSPAPRKRRTSHRSRSVQHSTSRHGTKPLTSPSSP